MSRLVAFFEITCIDFQRAVSFYEKIFELKMNVMDCGHEKMAFFPDEDGVSPGAISWVEGFKPSSDGVLLSLNCSDMNKTLSNIEKNGGAIVTQKTKIEAENRGYFSVFVDCEGNRLGLYSDK